MSRVIHFEIHAHDPERLVAFYAQLFGWEITRWPGPLDFWAVSTGPKEQPGIDGGVIRRHGPPPVDGQAVNAFVCTVEVADLDRTLAEALRLGAVTALPKMAVPGMGWLAYVKDPDGNILGITQPDPSAR